MPTEKCNSCQFKRQPQSVSGHTVEVITTAYQQTVRRLIAVIIIVVLVCVGSNLAWIIRENQFVDVETTYTIEAEQEAENGGSNFAVNGDLYGEAKG